MKAYEGFKSTKNYGDRDRLPAGNYVGKILDAKVEETTFGENLVIAFDIIEGEYAGYFQQKFDNDTKEDKKWKGVCRITIPNPDSKYFSGEKVAFENAIYSIEDSNEGYHWDWHENKLKGKIAGFRFRDKEFINNYDEVITFTECLNLVSAEDVRNGEAKLLKPKLLKPKDRPVGFENNITDDNISDVDDNDLPF